MRFADRFTSPVGTDLERLSTELPPGNWYTTNPFENYYALLPGVFAYHTGVDMILWPGGGAHAPLHACANGLVTFARRIPGTWGNVIVIGHTLSDGKEVYSRYGHVENMLVKAGDEVWCGQQIASEGNSFGAFPYHLHFDISLSRKLLTDPADWPGLDRTRLERNYVDPLLFIKEHAMQGLDLLDSLLTQAKAVVADLKATPPPVPPEPPTPRKATPVASVDYINVRPTPDTTGTPLGRITRGTVITVIPSTTTDWSVLQDTAWPGKFVYTPLLSFP